MGEKRDQLFMKEREGGAVGENSVSTDTANVSFNGNTPKILH